MIACNIAVEQLSSTLRARETSTEVISAYKASNVCIDDTGCSFYFRAAFSLSRPVARNRHFVGFDDHEPQPGNRIGLNAAIGQSVEEARPNCPFGWLLYDSDSCRKACFFHHFQRALLAVTQRDA